MSIRLRLTLTFALGTASVVAVVSALFLLALRAGLTGNLDATLTTRTAEVVAELGSRPAQPVTTEGTNGIVVQIYGSDGRVLDGSDQLGVQRLLSSSDARRAATGPVALDTVITAMSPGFDVEGAVRVVAVAAPNGQVVAAAASRTPLDDTVRRTGWLLLVVAVLWELVVTCGAWFLARSALRPVEAMRRQVASFVADAGHELRTPLTVLRGELELAGRPGRTVEDLRRTVATAVSETDRLVDLTENLLELARDPGPSAHVPVDVAGVTRDAVAAVQVHGATVVDRVDTGPHVVAGDPHGVRRALDNVLANAVRHSPPGSPVEVVVARTHGQVRVTVRDHGPGFPVAFLPHAFERFSQADPVRDRRSSSHRPRGTGLGLALVAAVMASQDGTARVSNHPDGGAIAELTWPAL